MRRKIKETFLIVFVLLMVFGVNTVIADDWRVVPIDSYDNFRSHVLNKSYDVDGQYGVQCWDGAAILWKRLGMSLSTGGVGTVRGCWEVDWARNQNAGTQFTLITNKADVRRGDVVVLVGDTYPYNMGHIGFADNDYNPSGPYNILDEESSTSGGRSYFAVHSINTNIYHFLGAFRYNGWSKQVGTLNLNGLLDGQSVGNISGYGIAKVYINGTLAPDGNGVSVYDNKQFDAGDVYRIVVTPLDGYSVDGTDVIEGMITANNTSNPRFTINSVWLKVNGVLDGQSSDSLNGYGTFDVVNTDQYGNNPVVIANDVSQFNARMKVGTYYEITDIKANDGYEYKGLTTGDYSYTGRFTQGGTTTVTLAFDSLPIEPTCDWVERNFIPSIVDSENWDIEVKNHYKQTGTNSPGNGWSQVPGSETMQYVFTGEYVTQPFPSSEANNTTLVLVDQYYYHYCSTAGNGWADYWQYGQYTRVGVALRPGPMDLSYYRVTATHKDSNDTNVNYYELAWTDKGTAATGYTGTVWCGDSPSPSKNWYLNYIYEKRQPVNSYSWTRDSEWLSLDQADSSADSITYRFRLKGCDPVSHLVTFKVVNGSWDDGTTADKTVTLNGIAADTLKLAASQIPAVGTKPAANYKAGEWGVVPDTETAITGNTTYTYTYAQKNAISGTVTFKVVNGYWDDMSNADKTVTLSGYEGDTLKLTAGDIPVVGNNPAVNFKAGSWDTTPNTERAILGNASYTYTYAPKNTITRTVTFKVVNGSWNDGTSADKTVTLTGHEGDSLKLAAGDIPAVGSMPNDTYKAGSWDTTPDTTTAITANKTYTYTYAADENDTRLKLIVSSDRARPGEEVTIDVRMENNPGIAQMLMNIVYDRSKLSFVECVDSGLTGWVPGVDTIIWESNQDVYYSGEIVKLKFKVSESAEEGDVFITVACEDGDLFSFDEVSYVPVVEAGKVTVYKNIPGDITGDGKVNSQDLLRLRRFLLNLPVEIY